MNRRFFDLIFLFVLNGLHSYAQDSIEISNVKSFSLEHADPFYTGDQLQGYYCYYKTADKTKNGKNYVVQTFDSSLKKVSNWPFSCGSKEKLIQTAFNGHRFLSLILDEKKQRLYHTISDGSDNSEMRFTTELDDNSLYYFQKSVGTASDEVLGTYLYTIGDKGYLSLIPTKHNNVFSYDVNLFLKDRNYQQITFTPETDVKLQKAKFLGNTDSLLIFHVMKKRILVNSTYESSLIGISISDGKKAFEISTISDGDPYYPLKMTYEKGSTHFFILGNYFKENDKIQKAKSIGLCMLKINDKGEVFTKHANSWEKDISRYLVVGTDKPADDSTELISRLQVHDFVQTSNGDLFIIGEGYKYRNTTHISAGDVFLTGLSILTFSAPGILMISAGSTNLSMVVTDMVVLHVSKDLEIDDVSVLYENAHPAYQFDYDFLHMNAARTSFSLAYRDYTVPANLRTFTRHSTLYDNGKFVFKQGIDITATSLYRVMPAAGNGAVLVQYDDKHNKVSLSVKQHVAGPGAVN